ncbi:small membrane protein [Thrush coronavirus HKU12-600]|uniref:Small membrane protein n=1 Tax=Thrush coronavirus HKU12 (isolate Grey-backed thrush/Hong Kong/HKU12-600/2007) TaxID=572290 RepID=B6VDX9_THCOV|nr:small membrane protein [Thrush coronavirus HKU12-600]ACJ12054.1 small membrane protein [Thrush coronavirus HKU12-600]QLI47742.1 MAG: E protein [Deltacoronavirus sp.]
MVVEDWSITIPGQYVIAALVILIVCVTLLFINTCLACVKLSYKCFLGARYLVNPIIVYYSKPNPTPEEEFVKIHQFPRNNYV